MPIYKNAKLKDHAYYRTGGTCTKLYAPDTIDELAEAVQEIERAGLPYFPLGGGTNSLVLDDPYDGAVIVFSNLRTLKVADSTVVCGAGIDNTEIAQLALRHGLGGAAWMNRLPGQIGGTVRMNARCYGGEISQICTKVTVVTRAGEIRHYTDRAVFRGYKDTLFMDNGDLIAGAELTLTPGADVKTIDEAMRFCATDRVKKGQFDHPSCGCVFKNDYAVGVSSGMLLDVVGGKQLKQGGAEVSPGHANFVFNKGATSRDILELSFKMRELVYAHFGVWMEYEMEVLGELPGDLRVRFEEVRPAKWDLERLAPLRKPG